MGHIKLVCRIPKPAPSLPGMPIINGCLPSLGDCEVLFVDDDGKEHPIPTVTRFTFDSGTGHEVTRARLELVGVEVDIEDVPRLLGDPVHGAGGRIVGRTVPRPGPVPPLLDDESEDPGSTTRAVAEASETWPSAPDRWTVGDELRRLEVGGEPRITTRRDQHVKIVADEAKCACDQRAGDNVACPLHGGDRL